MALSHSCRLHLDSTDTIYAAADMSVIVVDGKAGTAAREVGALQIVCADPQVASRAAVAFAELAEQLRKIDTTGDGT